jgi:Protein of unknown function (DUF1279)
MNPRIFLNPRMKFVSTFYFVAQKQQCHTLASLSNQQQHLHFHQKSNFGVKTGLSSTKINSHQFNLVNHIHKASCLNIAQTNVLCQKVKEKSDDNESKNKNTESQLDDRDEDKKLGLVARFKKMAKEYWYVLIPVHCFTSCFWFGGFYYASISGFDIVGLMEQWNFSDTLINPLRDSHLGHIAVAYLLYKIATPARYTVTLGGTTFAIKFLSKRGIIKPIPSKDKLMQMYKDKKDDLQQKVAEKKQEMQKR